MPNFTYNRGIPDGPDNPSDDQPNMKINTDSVDDLIAQDHVSFNTNEGGKHKFTHLLTQGSNPAVSSIEGVVFTKVVSSNTELFFRYGSAPQNTFQLTNDGAVAANNGRSSLIGPEANPIMIQWGRVVNPGTSGTVSFLAFSNPPYIIQLTLQRSSAGQSATVDNATPPTSSGFNYLTSSGGSNILYWLVIGN